MASQNATFLGPVTPDAEFDHPAGLPIVRALRADLSARGWTPGDFDDWRDCGWSISCRRDGGDLELIVASTGAPDEWMLQIAPARVPGLLGRALGKVPSATAALCHALATDVHAALSGRFSRLRWRWDGFPDEAHSTPTPAPPKP
jgi:hypothetical protein